MTLAGFFISVSSCISLFSGLGFGFSFFCAFGCRLAEFSCVDVLFSGGSRFSLKRYCCVRGFGELRF